MMCLGLLGLLNAAAFQKRQPREHPPVKNSASGQPDFATCTECHGQKASGQVVHAAVQAGCETCHAVETDEEETFVHLTADGNELCLVCHEEKRAQATQIALHRPLRNGKCVECHEPHSSSNTYLLRRASEGGEAAANLCLGCHKDIAGQVAKQVSHAAMDMGCSTCHVTHRAEPASNPEGIFHLTKPDPALCLDCHDAKDAAVQATHAGQPLAVARCTECHNPHGSDRTKLINNFVHLPFAEKQCDTCHSTPQEGKVVLVEGARRELCLTCHADMQERLEKGKAQHTAVVAGDCTACHSPHASAFPHQTRRGPVELCLTCHTDLAQARVEKAFLHRPVFEQSCLICHAEHPGERLQRLRADVNDLCLECHGSQNRTKFQTSEEVRLFGGSVSLAGASFVGMRILSIPAGATKGHPYAGHPVAGENLSCLTCHRPHDAGQSSKLLVTETATSTPLCLKCHK
jgi:predicted CXXCH cytochrome family protein